MVNSIFISPGVISKEKEFLSYTSGLGKTRLGVVGKTLKGPAFKPTKISNTDEYFMRFGATHEDYPVSYVSHSFLSQSNKLTVTRVLGKEGYTNSPAWIIRGSIVFEYGGEQFYNGFRFFKIDGNEFSHEFTITGNTSSPGDLVSVVVAGNNVFIGFSGSVDASVLISELNNNLSFSGLGINITGTSTGNIANGDAFMVSNQYVNQGSSAQCWLWGAEDITFEEMDVQFRFCSDTCGFKVSGSTLAVLRSKYDSINNEFFYRTEEDVQLGNVNGLLQSFMLSASTGPFTAFTSSGITISLDETKEDYIVKRLGTSPSIDQGNVNLYVDKIYPSFIRESFIGGTETAISSEIEYINDEAYTNFRGSYKHAQTPWIVSRVVGGKVKPLFKFHTICDGDAANEEIKISIMNIDPENKTFDVVIRNFYDLDSKIEILERFSRVTLKESEPNFIGKIIGTNDDVYPSKSKFVVVEIAEGVILENVPAGFEGYMQRTNEVDLGSNGSSASIFFKTRYFTGDTVNKAFLGITELAYSSITENRISKKDAIKKIDVDFFRYLGSCETGLTQTKGFHLENTADESKFLSGDKSSLTAYTTSNNLFIDKEKLKFTIVPAGGFDGWNIFDYYENSYDQFREPYLGNMEAFKEAIDTMKNPDEVNINLFSTPGIDFYNNQNITEHAIDVIENRGDAFYIIDSPRLSTNVEEIITCIENTNLNTSYASTYWPWIQVEDPGTGKYSFQSPTMLAVKTFARTDKVKDYWNAPAGMNRGKAGIYIIKTEKTLNIKERDELYSSRINPIAKMNDSIVIWGQKTLQKQQSALDRINVKRLILELRKLVSVVSSTLVFEQNTSQIRDKFKAKVEPLLLEIKNKQGLYGYKVIMNKPKNSDNIIDENTLTGMIQIQPSKTVEYIDLSFQLLPTGAKFEDF